VFYYERETENVADSLHWTLTQDSHHDWRKFYAPYRDSSGHLLYFSKAYQPMSVTFTIAIDSITGHSIKKAFDCHWDYSLNHPIDSGFLLLDFDTTLISVLRGNTEPYHYTVSEGPKGTSGYPIPPVAFNADDTTGGYAYHTFAMEVLPHEIRILFDSNVVRRIPDRLIPPGNPYYDWASKLERSVLSIHPGEMDIDNPADSLCNDASLDSHGNFNSVAYVERQFFDAHNTNAALGCWPVTIGSKTYPAAHHLVDYVKVWDVPADVKIPDYQQ